MGTALCDVPAGMQISEQWEAERDLFMWGVMPEHIPQVMDRINKHLMDVFEAHSNVDITMDSQFPRNADEVAWVKENPTIKADGAPENYIHYWFHPVTGEMLIIVVRPDIADYVDMRTQEMPADLNFDF